MVGSRASPFVTGPLQGDSFVGRETLIAEILEGPSDFLWVLGTRRIGKTSLLGQLALLCDQRPEHGYLPLHWDLSGVCDLATLEHSLLEARREAAPRLAQALEVAGTDPAVLDLGSASHDAFGAISELRRRLRSHDRTLLLLCDAAESLVDLAQHHASLLSKLRRTLLSQGGIRSVLASTPRLWALTLVPADSSPLLHGASPPLYLKPFDDDEARAYLSPREDSPASGSSPGDAVRERLCRHCGNHPYLLKLAAQAYLEIGDLDEALTRVADDATLRAMLAGDFSDLPSGERRLLVTLAEDPDTSRVRPRPVEDSTRQLSAARLGALGFFKADGQLRDLFLRRWLSEQAQSSGGRPGSGHSPSDAPPPGPPEDGGEGELQSPAELAELVYGPMRRLAGAYLQRERPGHTLQPTALVHEAFLKLVDQERVDWRGRSHFFAVGAQMMRRILIDHARARQRSKRGGNRLRVTLTGLAATDADSEVDEGQLLALHEALDKLASLDARQARVVELRFFAGMTAAEVAEALGISKRTADSDWAKARAWLEKELSW